MPETMRPASNIISTFIIIRKMPSVRMVMGSVNTISIGFTMAFKNASTKANIRAVLKDAITMCGANTMDNPYATTAVIRSRMMKFIFLLKAKSNYN